MPVIFFGEYHMKYQALFTEKYKNFYDICLLKISLLWCTKGYELFNTCYIF